MLFQASKLGFVAAISFALTATPIVGQTVSCFTSGTSDGGCTQFIDTFCQSGVDVELAPQDTFERCFNVLAPVSPVVGPYKCVLTAWNEFDTSGSDPVISSSTVANSSCETVLNAVADTCPEGGQGLGLGGIVEFTLIPEAGSCGPDGN